MNYEPNYYAEPALPWYMQPIGGLGGRPDQERRRAAYSLMNINQYPQRPIQYASPEDEYRAASGLVELSNMNFGDEHEGPPPVVRQNAERRPPPDPDDIKYDFREMYNFREMSFGKAKKTKKPKKITLKQLQNIARANNVPIFTRRKDGKGFTKKPLTVKALKTRVSRSKVPYRAGRPLGPLA